MRTIVKIAALAFITISTLACQTDKQEKLAQLKRKQMEINNAITELEKEIANTDTTAHSKNNGTPVSTQVMKQSSFAHYIEVQGKLDGEENVQVFPKTAGGVVQKVLVKVGDKVKKGQILATLDDAALKKSYEQVESQYKLSKDVYERQNRLWEQKIGSEIQYLQAKTQMEATESSLASLKEQLEYMKIKSPIDGTVEDMPMKVGQAVSAAYPAATVINFSSLKIVAEVAEAYSSAISKGDSVLVSFPDLNKEYKTTVSSASNFINPINRSFKVEVRLSSKDASFKANMITILRIKDYQSPTALSVPINLVQTDANGNYVFVAKDENGARIARKAYVTQGQSYKGVVEILSGLNEGDRLIVSGQLNLTEGSAIQF